ncbi:hypothetical protein [Polaribacter sp. L3A8]|uniref:hypothetical protein n=1 Tax=Polaribacter sp. L3A8 TaxID=2686361 RepID=UPI00131E52A5|nr:hypothetical protein [Polaribacter sp. L3A8]
MSLMFPKIYGIALDVLSKKDTALRAAGLVIVIVGGALMPFFTRNNDRYGENKSFFWSKFFFYPSFYLFLFYCYMRL